MKIELIEHFKKCFTLKQGYNHDKKTCSHSRYDLLPVNVQISSDILVCLFQSQLWQATSTSWSTSCPSSLMPSWTLRKGKISLIAARLWDDVRGLDSTGRCCCVVLECVPAQNSVSASLYSCPFSGGLNVCSKLCDSDLMQQTLTSKIQAPAHKATWPNRVLCLWNRMLQNSCVSFPQHAN